MVWNISLKRLFSDVLLLFTACSIIFYSTWSPLVQTYLELSRRFVDGTERPRCLPKHDVVFIKTHQTLHAPVQNILLRHALAHRLRVALPEDGNNFHYPRSFKPHFVVPNGSLPYNVICHNMRLDVKAVREITNKDAIWVTMLSEPAAMFETLFRDYWHDVPAFQKVKLSRKRSFESWIEQAHEFVFLNTISEFNNLARNPVYFSFGYSRFKRGYVELVLEYLDDLFNLVLIEEYLDESLVLLADLLCWDLSQVVQIRREEIPKTTMSVKNNRVLKKKVLQWNEADAALYKHFNATLWRRVDVFGRQKMATAVEKLKEIRSNLTEKCASEPPTSLGLDNSEAAKMASDRDMAGRTTPGDGDDCKMLTMSERHLSKLALRIQNLTVSDEKNEDI